MRTTATGRWEHMRLSRPEFRTSLEIEDAWVVCDAHHLESVTPSLLRKGCVIVDHLDQVPTASCVALIDTRAEQVLAFLSAWLDGRFGPAASVWLAAPVADLDVLRVARRHLQDGDVSLATLAFDGHWLGTRLSAAEAGDPDAAAALDAFELGRNAVLEAGRHEVERPSFDPIVERYASLLQFMAEHPYRGSKAEEVSEPKARDEAAELVNRLVSTQARLDALQRKYDALASSRLGRLTLAHWQRRRRS